MKYIFWDFNGTILDDAKLCYDILIEMLKEEERKLVTFDEYLMIFGFPIRDYYERVFDFEKTRFEILAHRFIKRYQPRSLGCKLHEGVVDAIKRCDRLGYVNVLLSASEEINLIEQLEHFQIKDLFKDILGTKNIYAKTKLDVARKYMEVHGIDPKACMMIGDTLHDAEIAENLGFDIILYTKGHQHPSRFKGYRTLDDFDKLDVI